MAVLNLRVQYDRGASDTASPSTATTTSSEAGKPSASPAAARAATLTRGTREVVRHPQAEPVRLIDRCCRSSKILRSARQIRQRNVLQQRQCTRVDAIRWNAAVRERKASGRIDRREPGGEITRTHRRRRNCRVLIEEVRGAAAVVIEEERRARAAVDAGHPQRTADRAAELLSHVVRVLLSVRAKRIGRGIETRSAERVCRVALNRVLSASSSKERATTASITTGAAASAASKSAASRSAPSGREAARSALGETARKCGGEATSPIESFGAKCAGRFELTTPQRFEPIAELTTIEARGVTGYGNDAGISVGREPRWQQPRRRICIVDRRRGRIRNPRAFRLNDLQLGKTICPTSPARPTRASTPSSPTGRLGPICPTYPTRPIYTTRPVYPTSPTSPTCPIRPRRCCDWRGRLCARSKLHLEVDRACAWRSRLSARGIAKRYTMLDGCERRQISGDSVIAWGNPQPIGTGGIGGRGGDDLLVTQRDEGYPRKRCRAARDVTRDDAHHR